MSTVPLRQLRRAIDGMAAARDHLAQGHLAATAAVEAGEFQRALDAAESAVKDASDAIGASVGIPPQRPPKNARRSRRKR